MAEIYGFTLQIDGNSMKVLQDIEGGLKGVQKQGEKTQGIFSDLLKFETLKQGFNLLKEAAQSTYKIGANIEQTKLSFDVLLGSSDKGAKFFKQVKEFADFTPFTTKESMDASQMLLNYGISAEKVIPYMTMLGDASAGNSEKFQRMSYAFAQISAMGRLQGQDLRQLVDAGFNPLQVMSEKTGKSMAFLKTEMEKGKITFDDVVNAFKAATSEGGRFDGMMIKQAFTTAGMASTLESAFQNLQANAFDNESGSMKEIIGLATEGTNAISKFFEIKGSEKLTDNMINMQAMFEVLKTGGLGLEQKRDLISELNGKYGEYLTNLVKESDTYADLARNQELSNDAMMKKIERAVRQEAIDEASQGFKEYAKDETKAKILISKIKSGGELSLGEKAWAQSFNASNLTLQEQAAIDAKYDPETDMNTLQMRVLSAIKNKEQNKRMLNDAINAANIYEQTGGDAYKQFLQGTKTDYLGASYDAKLPSEVGTISRKLPSDYAKSAQQMKDDAIKWEKDEREKTARGVGAAKVLNIYFNKSLLEVNASSVDTNGIKQGAADVYEQFAIILQDIVQNQGGV